MTLQQLEYILAVNQFRHFAKAAEYCRVTQMCIRDRVYASTNPNHIPEDVPVAVANISDLKMTVITTDPTQRYY